MKGLIFVERDIGNYLLILEKGKKKKKINGMVWCDNVYIYLRMK